MNTIKIKCPNCGAILVVAEEPSNLQKSVKCPICKERHRFIDFKQIVSNGSDVDDKTNLGGFYDSEEKTVLPYNQETTSLGYLICEENMKKYLLKEGVNLIGRMTYQYQPVATIPIETIDRGFSRKHLYIEACIIQEGTARYYAYNASNKNETSINGHVINAEDKVILHDGDVIQSSNTILVFHTK